MPSTQDDRDVPQFGIAWLHGDSCFDGRNYSSDISVGTRFTELVEFIITAAKDPIGAPRIERSEVRRIPIDCHVTGIEAYQHHLDRLPGGMTARLTLEGPSLSRLVQIVPRHTTDRSFVLRASSEVEPISHSERQKE